MNLLQLFVMALLAPIAHREKVLDLMMYVNNDDLTDLYSQANLMQWCARPHWFRQRPRVYREDVSGMDPRGGREDSLHTTEQSVGERLHRELRRPHAR